MTLNIGDSRVYLVRDGAIVQITTDHSVVQELVAAGRLSPEEAENHPYGNVITRAVGPSEGVTPDYVRLDVIEGDRFVICSDGLTKELTDYGIRHFLDENPDPADAASAMLEAALENGGRDNITIIVLDVGRPADARGRRRIGRRRRLLPRRGVSSGDPQIPVIVVRGGRGRDGLSTCARPLPDPRGRHRHGPRRLPMPPPSTTSR